MAVLGLLQEVTGIPAAEWLTRSPLDVALSLEAARALGEVRSRAAKEQEREREWQLRMRTPP